MSNGVKVGAREAQKADTRAALIDAGVRVFGAEGLDASLDAICAAAGFTRGAFYVHFADRDDFLVAVMDRAGREFLDRVLGAPGAPADLPATIAAFVASMASGDYPLTRPGGVKPHQLLDACARSPRVAAQYVALVADTLARVERTVKAGQRGRIVRKDVDASSVATVLLAAVVGAQTMLELGLPLAIDRAALTLVTLLAGAEGAPRRRLRAHSPGRRRRAVFQKSANGSAARDGALAAGDGAVAVSSSGTRGRSPSPPQRTYPAVSAGIRALHGGCESSASSGTDRSCATAWAWVSRAHATVGASGRASRASAHPAHASAASSRAHAPPMRRNAESTPIRSVTEIASETSR